MGLPINFDVPKYYPHLAVAAECGDLRLFYRYTIRTLDPLTRIPYGQLRITFPDCPESIAAKPFSKSLTAN